MVLEKPHEISEVAHADVHELSAGSRARYPTMFPRHFVGERPPVSCSAQWLMGEPSMAKQSLKAR